MRKITFVITIKENLGKNVLVQMTEAQLVVKKKWSIFSKVRKFIELLIRLNLLSLFRYPATIHSQ